MKNKKFQTSQLVTLGLMVAILLIMSVTPLGYLNIGLLSITLNMIPVAISAVVLGPTGGLIAGLVFGLTSFGQCIGIGQPSAFGVMLFSINPFYTFIVCVVTRALDGWLIGFIFRGVCGKTNTSIASTITGFCAAAINTVLFMTALMVLFGSTDYISEMRGGMNILAFVAAFVGINAVAEVITSTILTGAICTALFKARVIAAPIKK